MSNQTAIYEQYKDLQRQVIEAGLDPLPEYEMLDDWQRKQNSAYSDKGYCSRAIRQGKLPGVLKVGRDYIIPKAAEGVRLRSTGRSMIDEGRPRTQDGVRL